MDWVGTKPQYKDRWARCFISLFAAHFVDALGREDHWFDRMQKGQYWIDLIAGATIAFVLFGGIVRLTRLFDQHFDWMDRPVQRVLAQFVGGFVVMGFVAHGLIYLQFTYLYHQPFFTDWFTTEFPVVLLLLFMINVYYLGYYFAHRALQLQRHWQTTPQAPDTFSSAPINHEPNGAPIAKQAVIPVTKGGETVLLPVEKIALIAKEGDYGLIKTFDGAAYLTTESLDNLYQQLDPSNYYRANRQEIVNRAACEAFASLPYGKLELRLSPAHLGTVTVSQKRTKDFRQWILGKGSATQP